MDDTIYLSEKNRGCLSIYDYDFLESLLKNDVKLYGNFIGDIFVNKNSIFNWIKRNKMIKGWGYSVYKEIIDRDLYKWIESYTIKSQDYSKYMRVIYKLNYNDQRMVLDLLFLEKFKVFNKEHIDLLKKYSRVYLDIDMLQLDRYGIRLMWLPKIYKDSPNPFQEICLNIKNKRFRVLSEHEVMEYVFIDDILRKVMNGWKHKTKTVKKKLKDKMVIEDCSLCRKHDINDFTEDTLVFLPCGHQYHYTCWITYIKNIIKKDSLKLVELCCVECDRVVPNWELVC